MVFWTYNTGELRSGVKSLALFASLPHHHQRQPSSLSLMDSGDDDDGDVDGDDDGDVDGDDDGDDVDDHIDD